VTALSGSQVYQDALKAGFSPTDAVIATQVAFAESSWDPNKVTHEPNGSTSYGLMQINSVHTSVLTNGSWTDPVANMKMAKAIKDGKDGSRGGWLNWTTFKSGTYKEVKVRGNPFSAGSQDVSFSAPGKPTSFGVTGSTTGIVSTGSLPNPLAPLTDFLGKLSNPGLWTRVGIGALGVWLVIIGVLFLLWTAKDQVVKGTIGTAAKELTK
jgi:hypothetical protein